MFVRVNGNSGRPTLSSELSALSRERVLFSEFRYCHDTEIFGEAEPADFIYQIIEGAVRTYKLLSDGRRQIGALDTVNSLYEEPFFSCRQGGGSPPPAATGSPSPIRAVSEQHLHAVLSLVRRTGRRSSVPLASRPSGKSI